MVILNKNIFKIQIKNFKGQTASAAAAVINIDTDKAIFYNKNNQLCLTIQAKPGANETRIIGNDLNYITN